MAARVRGGRQACVLLVATVLACAPLSEGASGTDGTTGGDTGLPSSSGSPSGASTASASGSSQNGSESTVDPDSGVTTDSSTSSSDTTSVDPDSDSSSTSDGTTMMIGSEGSSSSGEPPPEDRRVFLSSQQWSGDLGGALGADEHCQDLADSAALGGTWRAYIIDPDNDLSRHTQGNRAIVLVDGTLVADDWDDLTDGSIQAPIDLDEEGQPRTGNAWTGFYEVGGADDNWCDSWTSNAGGCLGTDVCGAAGESDMTDSHWDGFFIFNCSDQFRLYCVEQ
jgi:hypothetical protein